MHQDEPYVEYTLAVSCTQVDLHWCDLKKVTISKMNWVDIHQGELN